MTITATHTTDVVTVKTNLDRRSVKLTHIIERREDHNVHLAMTVQHNDKGRYLVTVWRECERDGIITVTIMEDRARGEYHSVGARYSAKNLQALAAAQLEVFKRDIIELGDWAREMPRR